MIQEYLLQKSDEKDAIEAYKPEGVQKRIFSVGNENCWCIQFSINGENEEIARKLSEIDEYVQNTFHLTILEAGCSAYFNRRLYPLISEFEYNLRKLLYITSAIVHDDKSSKNISCLDSKDFGKIFSMLFIDKDFMEKIKADIKDMNINNFSKSNVIALIENTDESILCDKLLGNNAVPTLRERFNDIRIYRNDVMHSHYTNWKRFKEILSLYKAVNDELNNNLCNIVANGSKYHINPAFNQILEVALMAQEQIYEVFDVLKPGLEQLKLPLAEIQEKIK